MDLPKHIENRDIHEKEAANRTEKKRRRTWREIMIFCSAVFFFHIASLMSFLSMCSCDLCTFLKRHTKAKRNNNKKTSAVNINNDDVTWWARHDHFGINTHSATEQLFFSSRCCWCSDDDKKTFSTHTLKHIVWRRSETISWICGMEINWTNETTNRRGEEEEQE